MSTTREPRIYKEIYQMFNASGIDIVSINNIEPKRIDLNE